MAKAKKVHIFGLLVYALFGLYFINYTFSFIAIPEFISKYDSWLIFIGGILILFGAINYFRINKKSKVIEVKS